MRPFRRQIRLNCFMSGHGNPLEWEGGTTTDKTLATSWPLLLVAVAYLQLETSRSRSIALQKPSQTRSQTKYTNEGQRMITGNTKSMSAYLLGNEGFGAGRTMSQTEPCGSRSTRQNIRNMN